MRQHHQFRVNSHSHLHHGYQKLYRFLQLATIQLLNLHTSYIHTSTSIPSPAKTNMPPKGQKDSVATHAGASVTKNPTISKPPRSRPDASAAVQEAMARLAAAHLAAAQAAASAQQSVTPPAPPPLNPSNPSSHRSITPEASEMEVLQVKVASMESRNEAILNMLEEVKEKFEALENKVVATPARSEPKT